jgi:hypothetical protein
VRPQAGCVGALDAGDRSVHGCRYQWKILTRDESELAIIPYKVFDLSVSHGTNQVHFNRTIDKDIKSPDFLNAKQFPLITFKSKSVQKVSLT